MHPQCRTTFSGPKEERIDLRRASRYSNARHGTPVGCMLQCGFETARADEDDHACQARLCPHFPGRLVSFWYRYAFRIKPVTLDYVEDHLQNQVFLKHNNGAAVEEILSAFFSFRICRRAYCRAITPTPPQTSTHSAVTRCRASRTTAIITFRLPRRRNSKGHQAQNLGPQSSVPDITEDRDMTGLKRVPQLKKKKQKNKGGAAPKATQPFSRPESTPVSADHVLACPLLTNHCLKVTASSRHISLCVCISTPHTQDASCRMPANCRGRWRHC